MPLAGELVRASDMPQVKRKAADESVTSSTTLQNDDELSFAVVAGEDYVFALWLGLFSTSATPDVKVGFTFPAGTMSFGVQGGDPTTSVAANSGATSGTTALAVGVAVSAAPVAQNARVNGSFECSTTGTVRLQWAQNVSDGTAMTLREGSTLIAHKV